MMGELKLFLGIQIHQSPRGIFINQAKYAQEILINHGMTLCDSIDTPMATKHLDADLSGTPIDQTKYRSMVGALIWSSKKQDCTSMSLAEAESYDLSWKPCQGDSLNLPDHRIRQQCCSLIPAKSDSLTTCSYSSLQSQSFNVKIVDSKLPHHQRASKSNKESSIGEDC
ncbi:retrovirus-related pol polyprotein from transposon TNT 1-94 [Tanacetum coccineum]